MFRNLVNSFPFSSRPLYFIGSVEPQPTDLPANGGLIVLHFLLKELPHLHFCT
jgi:hypothetical protein